ncbi:MAG: helix-turn-helix domain-containing protein [Saprospiraceae bacterium]|nr:helix-turn-helix domain-containing protein [Saprospiraceae bacterium]
MDATVLFNILVAFGTFQALFMALVLLGGQRKGLVKPLFAILLLIEGITLLERLLADTNWIESVPHLLGISYVLSFIKPPLILWTAKAIIDQKFRLDRKRIYHLIPFFLMLLVQIPFYLMSAEEKLAFVRSFLEKVPSYTSFDFYLSLSFFAYIGIYLVLTLRLLSVYRQHIKNNSLANWNYRILLLYSLVMGINLVYFLILPSGWIEAPIFHQISMLVMTFLIQSVAYSFFSQAEIFSQNVQADLSQLQQRAKDEKRITALFEIDKVHLEDTLSLDQFAAILQLPKKYVSDIINQSMGCSFKELLNDYRIAEALSIMRENINPKKNLIDIAYDCGYTNKVSFYRSFKKKMGMAPSSYYQKLTTIHP